MARHSFKAVRGDGVMRICIGPRCKGKKKFKSEHRGNRLCEGCARTVSRLNASMAVERGFDINTASHP